MNKVSTRLGPPDLGYPGLLVVTSYVNEQGLVVTRYEGFDLREPKGEQGVDMTFEEGRPATELVAVHARAVSAVRGS